MLRSEISVRQAPEVHPTQSSAKKLETHAQSSTLPSPLSADGPGPHLVARLLPRFHNESNRLISQLFSYQAVNPRTRNHDENAIEMPDDRVRCAADHGGDRAGESGQGRAACQQPVRRRFGRFGGRQVVGRRDQQAHQRRGGDQAVLQRSARQGEGEPRTAAGGRGRHRHDVGRILPRRASVFTPRRIRSPWPCPMSTRRSS